MCAYYSGLGNELGAGLGDFAKQLLGTQNTLQQQAQQKAEQDRQYALQQQQAAEQTRQYDASAKQARDSQAFQWLNGQQQQLTTILAKGGFAKGSAEYVAAEHALQDTNKLMRRVLNGETLPPEDMQQYDTVLGNVAAITGQGAANVGDRVVAQDTASLNQTVAQTGATVAGTTATVDANARANEMQPFSVASAGLQNRQQSVATQVAEKYADPQAAAQLAGTQAGARTAAVGANVAEATQGDQITQAGLQTQAAQIGVDTARWQLGDLQAKAPLVYDGMRLSNEGAQQALDFNTAANPERLDALHQQNEQTRQQIDQNAELFPWQKDLLKSQLDMSEIQVEVAEGTKAGTIDGTNAQHWTTIAQAGNPALFDKYVKDGTMTAQQAAPWKRYAEAVARQRDATVTAAEAQATSAKVGAAVDVATQGDRISAAHSAARGAAADAAVAEGTVTPRIALAGTQAESARFDLTRAKALFPVELKSAQTALDTANFQLNLAKEKKPFDLQLLKAQVASLQQDISQKGQLFPSTLAAAKLQVDQLASEVRVLEGTESGRIQAGNAAGRAAEAQATSAQAAATVDVATIPAAIASRNLAPQQAQAALTAQLNENKFADKTFAARVQALDLSNSTGLQQLLTMKQQYSQNAAKFPEELKYLTAQTAVMNAQAKEAAAKALDSNGNGVTDRKTMITALTQMRMINGQNLRGAQSNLKTLIQRYIPNARFSVDKYDSKSFTTLVASQSSLPPEVQQQLTEAGQAVDQYTAESADLSTAFGQVGSKGRLDPKVASRLGLFSDSGSDGSDPYGVQDMGGVKAITKFTGTAPIPPTFNGEAKYAISKTAGNLGVDANALAAVISFETAGTFKPGTQNPDSSATGLIQFMADKNGKYPGGYTREQFSKLPFSKQMGYVESYLKGRGIGPGSSMADIYQAVAGSGYKAGTPAYDKNKVWDANGNGVIEPGEQTLNPQFAAHVRDYFGGRPAAGPQAPATGTGGTAAASPSAPALPNRQFLEGALAAAVKSGDKNTINNLGAQMVQAGYTHDEVVALLKQYQGAK